MVTSPHALASQAGVAILQAGGSAVDAAIAAAAVLSVIYPHMTSLGGDAFWLIHDAGTGAVRSLEAAGRAAAAATVDWFAARGLREIPVRGIVPATLTVPGAVDGWYQAHAAHGRLPLATDLAAAVGYARDGFPVTRRLAQWIERSADVLAADPAAARIFLGRRAESGGGPAAHQSGSRAHARARGRGAGRILRGGDRAGDGATRARARRLLHRARLRRAARDVGRLHPRHLSRRHHPPDAAAEPGRVGLAIAPAARAAGDRRAALPGAGPRAPARAGQADRLPRPGPLRRRSRVLPGAGRALAIPCLRRRAAGPHGPQARAALGPRPVERQPDRRYGLRRGGGRRRATRSR